MTDPNEELPEKAAAPKSTSDQESSTSGGNETLAANTGEEEIVNQMAAKPSEQLEDELPEFEPLTPEIVEEEAIRGDFMLRWAAIFLAVLFGFSQIAETRTLVHIRSGEQLRANGFLPGSSDAFAYSLESKPTANVSWLFDHVVSAAYAAGGEYGLTIFKALIAGLIAYFLSLISVPGMPTWWSSICCVLAIGACSVDFVPVTDLATLLGVTLTLLLLHSYAEGRASGIAWKLPVLIAVWGNLDPQAYMGVIAVALFSLGLMIRKSFATKEGDAAGPDAATMWKATAACVIALAINPAPLSSLMSVVTTYTVEYPAMAAMRPLTEAAPMMDGRTEYFSVWDSNVRPGFEFAYLSGTSLLLIAIVVLLISRSREDIPLAIVMLGFAGLAAFKLHELPAASLAAAAAAGTAAQRWYRRSFRMDYTVETMEVLFSRGGRAVTVFAMAFLGFCVVADRLPTRTPVGMGFEPDLKTTATTLQAQLAEISEESNVFPTRMSQGDFLIWSGRKTFIDSRARLYGQYTDPASLIHQFDVLRQSLLFQPAAAEQLVTETEPTDADSADSPDTAEASSKVVVKPNPNWKSDYDKFNISHVMVRLAPPGLPAYSMATAFLQSPSWQLTERGPSAMFFQHTDQPTTKIAYDSRDVAFRTSVDPKDPERFEFAREKDFYSTYLYASRATQDAPLREAQHYLRLDSQLPPQVAFNVATASAQDPKNPEYMALLGRILAGPTLTIRNANLALAADNQNATAYRLLGVGYAKLNELEKAIAAAFGGDAIATVRNMQAIMALRQSTVIEPEFSDTWLTLMSLYESQGRTGLALDCLDKYLEIEEDRLLEIVEEDERLSQLYQLRTDWKQRRDDVIQGINDYIEQGMPTDLQEHAAQKFQMVQNIYNEGHVQVALDLAEDNIDLLRSVPDAELLRGRMLLEVGRLEDGYAVLNQLAAVIRENAQNPEFARLRWHESVALSQLSKGVYTQAIEVWNEQLNVVADVENKAPELSQPIVANLPLVAAVEAQINGRVPNWPILCIQAASVSLDSVPSSRHAPLFLTAIANIESGNVANAKFILEGIIKDAGGGVYRPLAEVYLSQLTDDAQQLMEESYMNSWENFEFPEVASDAQENDSPKATNPKPEPVKDQTSATESSETPKPAKNESGGDKSTESTSGNSPEDSPAPAKESATPES